MIALLSFLLLSATAFGQSIGGTVMDVSRGVIPGADVMAKNDGTGIESKTTVNNSGAYNFPSLPVGTYTVTVEARGFQRAVRTEVRVGIGAQINLPFELAVAGTVEEVEVTGAADSIILEAGSSTGTVLQEEALAQLPLVANDALGMLNMMGGVVASDSPVFYAVNQTIAGVMSNNINMTRDGISVNEVRYNSGVTSPARLNTELVGEMKMVLSPVDAEMGRGAGQIQMITRSGSNVFHGSGVWNVQNTALDAYNYSDKHRRPDLVDPLAWRNLHNYVLTASGPIIQNKTFFFVSWDQAIARSKTYTRPAVLTNCARKGIYRWFGNTINGNAGMTDTQVTVAESTSGPRFGISPTRPVVNPDGTPRYNYTFPVADRLDNYTEKFSGRNTTGTVYDELHWQSVLGPLSETAYNQVAADPVNCSQYLPGIDARDPIPTNTNFGVIGTWDNYRTHYDQSGFVSRMTAMLPPATDFQTGDGLNTAGFGWTRMSKGTGNIFGQSTSDDDRKAITFKIDHNINSQHRASGTYSYESSHGVDMEPYWPSEYNAFGGLIDRKPQTFTASLTSTLRPTLLNEFKIGMSRTQSISYVPMNNPQNGDKMQRVLMDLLGNTGNNPFFPNYNDMPILVGAGSGAPAGGTGSMFYPTNSSHPYGGRGNVSSTWGGHDPRWTFADTVTWMKGAHSFKGGAEYRWQQSYQQQDGPPSLGTGVLAYPQILGGVINLSPQRNLGLTNPNDGSWAYDYFPDMPKSSMDNRRAGENPGTLYNNAQAANGPYAGIYNLLTYMSGSVSSVSQYFFAVDAKNPRWNNPATDGTTKYADLRNRELAFFFKDDWKITRDVTLNLGIRYEYYGIPFDANGTATNVANGITGAFGISGGDFGTMLPRPEQLRDDGALTRQIFVGPNSPNPDLSLHNKDLNNFAPHVGFAWQLPWFGKGQTTLRGGYSISYTKVANYDNTFGYALVMAYQPATNYARSYNTFTDGCLAHIPGESQTGCYLDLTNAGKLLPLYQESTGWVGMPTWQQPTVLGEQWVGRRENAAQMFDPDIVNPYVQNINMSVTRQVGRALTIDVRYISTLSRKMTNPTGTGLNVNTVNLVNSGIMDEIIKLRRDGPDPDPDNWTNYPIMNRYIRPNTLNAGQLSGSQQVWNSQQGSNLATGAVNGVLGAFSGANCGDGRACQNVQGMQAGNVLRYGGAPENLFIANPQYTSLTIQRNQGSTNYHSMQTQVTMRPMHGLNFQATYTWSRNLSRAGSPVDYRDWSAYTYNLSGQHRSHALTFNGSYTLPFGANGFVLRNASGTLKKVVEGWNIGWMGRMSSGNPLSIGGSINSLWNSTRFDQVGPFDTKQGKVDWDEDLGYGFYAGRNKYERVIDPQCFDTSLVHPDLRSNCAGTQRALIEVSPNGNYTGYRSWADYNSGNNPITGNLIFVNPKPGTTGNFRPNSLTGQGSWNLDANMGKTVSFMEGKTITIRVDAQNIFNHATPSGGSGANGARDNTVSTGSMTINGTSATSNPFGYISTKTGHRTFQGQIRLAF